MIADVSFAAMARSEALGDLMRDALRVAGAGESFRLPAGPAAIAEIGRREPDCLFLALDDTAAPMMRALRSSPASPNPFLPVVALVTQPSPARIAEVVRLGFHEALGLPFTGRDLGERVARSVFIGRPFVHAGAYQGPCRRRRASPDYRGPERRGEDPAQAAAARQAYEARAEAYLEDWRR